MSYKTSPETQERIVYCKACGSHLMKATSVKFMEGAVETTQELKCPNRGCGAIMVVSIGLEINVKQKQNANN